MQKWFRLISLFSLGAAVSLSLNTVRAEDANIPSPSPPAAENPEPKPAPETATPAPDSAPKTESEKPVDPADPGPPLTEYQGRKIAQTMHYTGAPWLQRASRVQEEEPGMMQDQLDVKPGQTVCDMGSGDGYHTLWLARAVGEKGKVYAVDIQKEMLQLLQSRAKEASLTNIELVLGLQHDPKLAAESQDLILLVDVYHEISYPEQMLDAMRKALKPGGRMVLVEFRAEDPKVPIKPEHKMSKEQILKEIPPRGFKLVKEVDKLPWQHMMFFERDDSVKVP